MKRSIITASLAALVASASIATADTSFFSYEGAQSGKSYVTFDSVTADSDAVVEIRDFRLGEVGDLLGTETVHAGANTQVKVRIGEEPLGDVIAILKSGDQVLATQEVDINRN
ncbi:hypothetical protein [Poseidonocella sedimentorum]|uniref:Uncharacterized protein n=1 Tax=Poseidonocella sedimentorum TaxID=871652 RepID=A0A1I6DS60_9RHOB|nr:hypothetical protein [Poseidonocella sedimentorum]SFR08303.1 hypothetical protein SAMN04515673_10539 [Poseidonocella sedimentorum]